MARSLGGIIAQGGFLIHAGDAARKRNKSFRRVNFPITRLLDVYDAMSSLWRRGVSIS